MCPNSRHLNHRQFFAIILFRVKKNWTEKKLKLAWFRLRPPSPIKKTTQINMQRHQLNVGCTGGGVVTANPWQGLSQVWSGGVNPAGLEVLAAWGGGKCDVITTEGEPVDRNRPWVLGVTLTRVTVSCQARDSVHDAGETFLEADTHSPTLLSPPGMTCTAALHTSYTGLLLLLLMYKLLQWHCMLHLGSVARDVDDSF